jgi:negative regulator of flagellin synthesis FlgM
MTDIPPINGTGRLPGSSPVERLRSTREAPPGTSSAPVDRVEISDTAQALSSLDPDSSVRAEKVAEIRDAIANGTYLTDEKISIAADRLLDTLRASLTL